MTANFTGFKTKRLEVIKPTTKREGGSVVWECKCKCGNTAFVSARSLNPGPGKTPQKSCGKCGDSTHPLHAIWIGIKSRCYDISNPAYKHYGARGIVMSLEWREDFLNFVTDMGPRPEGYSVERINVNGNYEKENCKWANATEQAYNKRNLPRKLTDQDLVDIYFAPIATPIQYIAEKYNISLSTVSNIRCLHHSREKMLMLIKELKPRSIFNG